MKPYCRGCRYYYLTSSLVPSPVSSFCTHPSAKVFSRVNGYTSPVLNMPGSERTTNLCDKNGWFEPIPERKPWWRIWRAA